MESPLDIHLWSAEKLEKSTKQVVSCKFWQLKLIANAYQIHLLMLDSLLTSEDTSQNCWIQPFESLQDTASRDDAGGVSFVHARVAKLLYYHRKRMGEKRKHVNERLNVERGKINPTSGEYVDSSEHKYGSNARYRNPFARLPRTDDIALLCLELEPGQGTSDWHQHPGDEVMLVLEGAITVHLQDTGIRSFLNRGDYIHFYAEQMHGAVNDSEKKAVVLVMRFMQVDLLGTRYSLHEKASERNNLKTHDFVDQMRNHVLSTLMPFDLLPSGQQENRAVIDREGLGRLLAIAATVNEISRHKQVAKLSSAGLNFDVQRLLKGDVPVLENQLVPIAAAYEVYPAVLFDYLHPVFPTVVQVGSCDTGALNPNGRSNSPRLDWEPVPHSFCETNGVHYLVPKQRLAFSDISIAYLEIENGASTEQNIHPGFEVLVPIHGAVQIETTQGKWTLNARKHLYAMYPSNKSHTVRNGGEEVAKVMVFRFYSDARDGE